jgi:hypothetical protein
MFRMTADPVLAERHLGFERLPSAAADSSALANGTQSSGGIANQMGRVRRHDRQDAFSDAFGPRLR